MATVRTRVGPGGRVVIPAEFRATLGIRAGDDVIVRVEDGEVRIATTKEGIRRAQEIVRRYVPEGQSLVDDLIEERRREAADESRT